MERIRARFHADAVGRKKVTKYFAADFTAAEPEEEAEEAEAVSPGDSKQSCANLLF